MRATHHTNPATPKATTSAAGAATQPKSSSGGGVVPLAGVGQRMVIETPGAPSEVTRGFRSIWVATHRELNYDTVGHRFNLRRSRMLRAGGRRAYNAGKPVTESSLFVIHTLEPSAAIAAGSSSL